MEPIIILSSCCSHYRNLLAIALFFCDYFSKMPRFVRSNKEQNKTLWKFISIRIPIPHGTNHFNMVWSL